MVVPQFQNVLDGTEFIKFKYTNILIHEKITIFQNFNYTKIKVRILNIQNYVSILNSTASQPPMTNLEMDESQLGVASSQGLPEMLLDADDTNKDICETISSPLSIHLLPSLAPNEGNSQMHLNDLQRDSQIVPMDENLSSVSLLNEEEDSRAESNPFEQENMPFGTSMEIPTCPEGVEDHVKDLEESMGIETQAETLLTSENSPVEEVAMEPNENLPLLAETVGTVENLPVQAETMRANMIPPVQVERVGAIDNSPVSERADNSQVPIETVATSDNSPVAVKADNNSPVPAETESANTNSPVLTERPIDSTASSHSHPDTRISQAQDTEFVCNESAVEETGQPTNTQISAQPSSVQNESQGLPVFNSPETESRYGKDPTSTMIESNTIGDQSNMEGVATGDAQVAETEASKDTVNEVMFSGFR